MSDEFRVMNSLDDLIHVRIDHWKLFAGHVLVDDMRLTMTSERGGRQVARIQSARVSDKHIVKHKQGSKLRRIQPKSKFTRLRRCETKYFEPQIFHRHLVCGSKFQILSLFELGI